MTDTTKKQSAARPYLFSAILIFALTAVTRGIAVVNAFLSTDIRYLETALPAVLDYLRQGFSAAVFGASAAAVTAAVYRSGRKGGGTVSGICIGIGFADALAAFLIDTVSGMVSDAMIPLALMSVFFDWIWYAVLILLVWGTACLSRGRKRSADRAVILASLIHMAGRLILETVYLIQFLIEVEFMPYAREIAVIAGQYLSIVFFHGGLTWIAAAVCLWVLDRVFLKK